ncbi:MAG TPA: dTDP-4-dehydrorhamnose 3,5-epimerase family protein [Methanospirillum sp.]|jgi:hypothetical protein|uniref:dTDP-4-dehydrorhamnose 3,5-epimerase family protein n=1 Tax=Methanospirillum sp. TaxID=45200 RepID=UPI001BD35CF9|nr:dTDP-4-dehydrorhamnose 3,5-epimerase family protein [Methanospirillum sp.]HPY60487.1 dTDP-4-dehydrorhamnose 3,5-epimerase family protein [Methanospirillum sp.]HQB99871.1 dTDP-4-dehydrorhamnose 3,5-epimerase family protein [Methanospirillum sp.]
MQVVILCGGLGTRLKEGTEFRPKPMVPIGGRPIIWHIMQIYAKYGHKEFFQDLWPGICHCPVVHPQAFHETRILRLDAKKSESLLGWRPVWTTREAVGMTAGWYHDYYCGSILYFTTAFYAPDYEGGIRFNDPKIDIHWPLPVRGVSERDMNHPLISDSFKGI